MLADRDGRIDDRAGAAHELASDEECTRAADCATGRAEERGEESIPGGEVATEARFVRRVVLFFEAGIAEMVVIEPSVGGAARRVLRPGRHRRPGRLDGPVV